MQGEAVSLEGHCFTPTTDKKALSCGRATLAHTNTILAQNSHWVRFVSLAQDMTHLV